MTYEEIKNIISQGEGMNIEFKKSTTDITKDVYETVCRFQTVRAVIFCSVLKMTVRLSEWTETVQRGLRAILLHQ